MPSAILPSVVIPNVTAQAPNSKTSLQGLSNSNHWGKMKNGLEVEILKPFPDFLVIREQKFLSNETSGACPIKLFAASNSF
jgi:hypothetical protein